ncbi:nickel transporter [Methanoculleus taiwanensis]|uniref:Nickel transporter n=1 Tax=Methanoculleus taiwanensis TaxID=1550565 RepID=A0A498GZ27_9EURY|nr:HisA/HisF-related TIM barrel protein [Methanoculleus taiwanensis]RXE55110.1 nickel transporter [Methanoculleus taiwanensis]
MELILAVDLAGGQVVHGKKGERESYRPLTWGLAPSAEPVAYVSHIRPKFLYIADLDRIRGGRPHDDLVGKIAPLVERCYLDRGCRSPRECTEPGGVTSVIGTETAARTIEGLAVYPGGFLSADIRDGRVIPWGIEPAAFLKEVRAMPFEGCILLNIGAVGTEGGLAEADLEEMRSCYPGRLFYGGGVAGPEDIYLLADLGFDGAIVATAVHRGSIPLAWIRSGKPC